MDEPDPSRLNDEALQNYFGGLERKLGCDEYGPGESEAIPLKRWTKVRNELAQRPARMIGTSLATVAEKLGEQSERLHDLTPEAIQGLTVSELKNQKAKFAPLLAAHRKIHEGSTRPEHLFESSVLEQINDALDVELLDHGINPDSIFAAAPNNHAGAPIRNSRARGESHLTRAVKKALTDAPGASNLEISLRVDEDGVQPLTAMEGKSYEDYYETPKGKRSLSSRYAKIRRTMRKQGLLG